MTRTSSISGTFVDRQRSPVRVAAASSFRAAFFAPLIATVPLSGRPPSMSSAVCSTGSGRYSHWKGRASAMVWSSSVLAAVPRTLAMTALGDPDPEERLLERRSRGRQVGALAVADLECALGLAAGLLGSLAADVRPEVGPLGPHHDLFP